MKQEKMMPYDGWIIKKMYEARMCGVPLIFYLLDIRKTDTYCHFCSALFTYFIGGVWMTGDVLEIKGNDKSHSWVEMDEFVYDTSKEAKWRRKDFYERYHPTNVTSHERSEAEKILQSYLKYNKNRTEMYIAIIRDIEQNRDGMPYALCLEYAISLFKREKELENAVYNEELVNKYMMELDKLYQHTEEFKMVI